ncbi:MAG TPA: 3-oxoadipyl-CoA thiolase [Bacteroidales bacterium]|nr:3-oxoadipyl-CoA thiolase [Bacteroidales bacterium]HRZ48828.1 3-oxoadipyl-CoA thiolase [Bacteroidales bacterium]
MNKVFICDAKRTPVGRYGGALSPVRPDDLAARVIAELLARNPGVDPSKVDDVILGCANQAGEDNRNVARMALLLAGLPVEVPGVTVNRLCGSGMDAIAMAARTIATGDADLMIAGGVESMSRAPLVMDKASEAFARNVRLFDTTIGWRFINPLMDRLYGTDSMMQTAENLATEMQISREDQDLFAFRSQEKAAAAQQDGSFNTEIVPVKLPALKGVQLSVEKDEHPRATTPEKLASLKPLTHPSGTITAGNSSGINDGAAALLLAAESAVKRFGLTPLAVVKGAAVAGVPPRVMGIGPVPATLKLLARLNLTLSDFDLIELNEAFAAQSLACIRQLGLKDDDPRINPLGGAIALGHPLGMSGARLVTTATHQLQKSGGKLALCTMCIGVGQGIAMVIERI